MSKYLGKDGGWYDNYGDYRAANTKYEQQEKQNKLLEQQNRLIEQQNQLNYQLEYEKIQTNYELEMNKLHHEEKMRILRLFDDIGISKETYDTYINNKFMNETTNELLKQKDEHLLVNSKYDFLLHEEEKRKELGHYTVDEIMKKNDMYSLKNPILNDCYTKISKSKQKERKDLEDYLNKSKQWFKWSILSLLADILVIILNVNYFENSDWLVGIIVMSIPFVVVSLLLSGLLMYRFNKDLDMLPTKIFSREKYFGKLNKLILEEQEAANKITEKIKSNNESLVSKFYDFRINNYNSSIEKLLIDVGFKELVESLGLEYKKVNNSNKKKDGTIEDYIEYFETNS